MTKAHYDKVDLPQIVRDAKRYLNFELNEKKVKRTDKNGEIKFLGY